jgi:hypothetical protein
MWPQIVLALIQFTLPEILAMVASHQAANKGAMPTPQQVVEGTPSLQILQQGQAWLDANKPPIAKTP